VKITQKFINIWKYLNYSNSTVLYYKFHRAVFISFSLSEGKKFPAFNGKEGYAFWGIMADDWKWWSFGSS